MSVALYSRPDHQSWHDVESFYWLLIFIVVRHGGGLQLSLIDDGTLNLDNKRDRQVILSHIFSKPQTGEDALSVVSKCKKGFLLEWSNFTSTINQPLARLLNALTRKLRTQYSTFDSLHALEFALENSAPQLGLAAPIWPSKNIFATSSMEEVNAQYKALAETASAAKGALETMKRRQSEATKNEALSNKGEIFRQ